MLLAVTLPLGVDVFDLSRSSTEPVASFSPADGGFVASSALARTVVQAAVSPSQVPYKQQHKLHAK